MVFEILKIGEKDALSPEYLRALLGFSSIRAVQKQIERERAEGKVILSSTLPPGGYYRPENPSEIRRFIRTLENRGQKTIDALNSARKMLTQIEGADRRDNKVDG